MTGRQVQQEIQTSKLWRCRAWAVIGLLPVLAWITMFVWSLFIYNQPINTGDKLQDRYLTELASMAEHLMFQDSMSSPHWVSSKPVGYIPDLVLAAIEAEFADDPRYWMLRFHNTYSGGFYAQSRNPDQISRRDVLELARDQGVVNGPILLSLLKSYESEWKETAAREVPPPQNPLTFSPAQNRADIWAVVDEQHCVELRQLAAE